MNRISHSSSRHRAGFTLVEILAAVAVLSIIVVSLAQVLSVTSQTWQQGVIRSNDANKGRSILDQVAADIQRGVFRADLQNFPQITTTAPYSYTFFSRIPGKVDPNYRDVSKITYSLNLQNGGGQTLTDLRAGNLFRIVQSIQWTDTTTLVFQNTTSTPSPGNSTTSDVMGNGVIDFEMLFIRADGTVQQASDYKYPGVNSTSSPVTAIMAGVVVIDDQTLKTLGNTAVEDLNKKFSQAVKDAFGGTLQPLSGASTSLDLKNIWDGAFQDILKNGTQGYPRNFAIGLRTYQRVIACPPFS